jgi:hypothetical protein
MADDDDFQNKGPAYDPLDEYASYEDYLDNQVCHRANFAHGMHAKAFPPGASAAQRAQ